MGTEQGTSSVGRRILRGVISGVGLTVISIVVVLIQMRLAVAYLPRELAGVWMLLLTFATYVSFLDLGFSPTLSREIAFVSGRDNAHERKHQDIANLISTTFRVFLALTGLTVVVGGGLGLAFLWSVTSAEYREQVGWAWVLFTFGAGASVLSGAAFASLYGMGDVATERILKSIAQIVWLIVAYVALASGLGLMGLVAAWTIQTMVARGAALVILRRRYPWLRMIVGVPSWEIFSRMAGPSIRWAIMGLGAILILHSSNLVIAAKLGPAAIPPYEAVARIAMTLMTVSLYIVTSSTPFISAAHAASDRTSVVSLIMRNMRVSMWSVAILSAYVAIFCEEIVRVWLGPEFFPGWNVVWTLLVMVILETHHVTLAAATMASGRLVFAHMAVIAGVLNIAFALALVELLGLWGIALAVMFAQLLTNNWYAPYVTFRVFDLPLGLYHRQVVRMFMLVFGLSLGANFLAREWLPFMGLRGLLVSLAVATVVAILLAAGLVTTPQERRRIIGFLRANLAKT